MNWAKWDAEHGSGGSSVSSADKIAAQIRGALGAPRTDAPEIKSTRGKSGSVVSRAESARSSVAHVQKKDMKRPALAKGEKNPDDAFRTKIRMAEYNRKKAAAAKDDPVNTKTPHTEEKLNPHTRTADKIGSKTTARSAVERPVSKSPRINAANEATNTADRATAKALADPTPENHKAAFEAHRAAFTPNIKAKRDAAIWHHSMMETYHAYASNSGRPTPGVIAQHEDRSVAHLLPAADDSARTSEFNNTEHQMASEARYKSLPEVRSTGATDQELASVYAYTRGSDTAINGHLRGTSKAGADSASAREAKDHISRLDSVFARQKPLAQDLTTYRGVSKAEDLFGPVGSRVGSQFVDHGYSSTSTHANDTAVFGSRYNTGALVRVITPAGNRVVTPAGAGGFGRSEHEVMLNRGSSYHVAADRMVRKMNGQMQRQIDLIHMGAN